MPQRPRIEGPGVRATIHYCVPTIAALDLSIRSTGYAVVRPVPNLGYGRPPGAIAYEVRTYGHTPLRTADQVTDLVNGILTFAPDLVAIEATFISVNAKTGIDLAVLRGRVLQALEARGIATMLVQPSTWRKTTICPPPKAKRKELKALAKAYALRTFQIVANEDEADALCLAAHVGAAKSDANPAPNPA